MDAPVRASLGRVPGSAGPAHRLVTGRVPENPSYGPPVAGSFHSPSTDGCGPGCPPPSPAHRVGAGVYFGGLRGALDPLLRSDFSPCGLACAPTQDGPGRVRLTQGREPAVWASLPPPSPGHIRMKPHHPHPLTCASRTCAVSRPLSSWFSQPRGDQWAPGLRPDSLWPVGHCLWLPRDPRGGA